MYCIKCGVELADSEKKCPLCGTVVFHPEIIQVQGKPPYPPYENTKKHVNTKGILLIISLFFALVVLLSFIIDLKITSRVTWSGYAVCGIVTAYVIFVLPLWFKYANPVIFSSADFFTVGLLLFYINFETGGHWFLSFAFPLVGCAALVIVGLIALIKYVGRGFLYMAGGALIAQGLYVVLIEVLINYTFGFEQRFLWSLYPLTSCLVLGLFIIVIAVCKPLRQILHKKFFV